MKLFGNSRNAARVSGKRSHDSAQKAPAGKKRIGLIVALSILAALVVAAAMLLLFYFVLPDTTPPNLHHGTIDPDTNLPIDPEKPGTDGNEKVYKEGYYNILIAGTDNDGLRTDTIMIARINTTDHTVAILSIPRDTMIETSNGPAKINSVYATYGLGAKGMGSLMLEVEDLLGFMPNGYILVNLKGFIQLVDTIGGVYFNVPQDMYHVDPTQDLFINLKKGYQYLDGNKAMQLVRYRGYATADIQRTHVQQDFLVAVAKKCLSLSNVVKIDEFIDIFVSNVKTEYTAGNLVALANELLKCDFDNMNTYTLKGEGGHYVGGVDYYKADEDALKEVVMKDFYPYTK